MQPKVQVDSELAEMEMYYKSEIDYKVSLVKNHLNDESILEDLAAMDQAFAELKVDLKDNVDNEEVVSAMMENYQLKLKNTRRNYYLNWRKRIVRAAFNILFFLGFTGLVLAQVRQERDYNRVFCWLLKMAR